MFMSGNFPGSIFQRPPLPGAQEVTQIASHYTCSTGVCSRPTPLESISRWEFTLFLDADMLHFLPRNSKQQPLSIKT